MESHAAQTFLNSVCSQRWPCTFLILLLLLPKQPRDRHVLVCQDYEVLGIDLQLNNVPCIYPSYLCLFWLPRILLGKQKATFALKRQKRQAEWFWYHQGEVLSPVLATVPAPLSSALLLVTRHCCIVLSCLLFSINCSLFPCWELQALFCGPFPLPNPNLGPELSNTKMKLVRVETLCVGRSVYLWSIRGLPVFLTGTTCSNGHGLCR